MGSTNDNDGQRSDALQHIPIAQEIVLTGAWIRFIDTGLMMVCSSSKTVIRLLLIYSLGLGALSYSFQSLAGEKIQITKRTGRVNSAANTIKNGLYSDPMNFIGSRGGSGAGSLVPSLPPPASAGKLRSKKEDEENWMFDADGNIDQAATLKRILGVRDYNNFGQTKNRASNNKNADFENETDSWARGSGKNWFDSAYRSTQKEPVKGLTPEADSEANSPFEKEEPNSHLARRPELNLNSFLTPMQSNEVFSASTRGYVQDPFLLTDLTRGISQSEFGRFGRTKEQENKFRDFQKMIGVQPTLFVDQLKNALNSQPDVTRKDLNPVRGQVLEGFSPLGVNPFDMSVGVSSTRTAPSSSRVFESFNSRSLEKASLTPAMIIPPPVPVFQPRPTVLEMPRRKF